jgi:hypothetical protein
MLDTRYSMLDLFPPYQGGIKGGVRYSILDLPPLYQGGIKGGVRCSDKKKGCHLLTPSSKPGLPENLYRNFI